MAHPLRERLRGFALITEILGRDWARGRLQDYPDVCFELSFEPVDFAKLPGTGITYLGIMSGKRTIFEFQCGKVITSKTPDDDYQRYVFPFIERLQRYDNAQASFDRSFAGMMYRRD